MALTLPVATALSTMMPISTGTATSQSWCTEINAVPGINQRRFRVNVRRNTDAPDQ
jgi:hypothetical protein